MAQLRFTDYVYAKANVSVTNSRSSKVIEPECTLTPIGTMASHAAVAEHILG